jgi:uncharacterized cupin superfamily protein
LDPVGDDRGVQRINLHLLEPAYDGDDPNGYRAGMSRFGPDIGAVMMGGTVYELPAGQSICPYHYEYGDEEWVIVLEGRPTLRHPEGEDVLEPGDVVCFPEGPEGAHKLTNTADAKVRVLFLSTKHKPTIAVYPDGDKIGIWPGDERDNIMVRRESAVGYWDREAES